MLSSTRVSPTLLVRKGYLDWLFIRVSPNVMAKGNTFCHISWASTQGGGRHVGAW